MQRDTVLAVVLAVLALLALGVAAATLTDTVSKGESGTGAGAGEGAGQGTATQPGQGDQPGGSSTREVTRGLPAPPFCAEFLKTPRAIAAILGAIAILLAYAYYDTGSVLAPIGLFLGVFPPVFLFWYVITACGTWTLGIRRNGTTENVSPGIQYPGGSGGGAGEAVETATSTPSVALGLLLVLAIAVAVVLLFVSTGDAVEVDDADEEEEDLLAPDIPAIGRAAGRAAERIEGPADVENEVYRAWVAMTRNLAVEHPESSTPAEFAEAAIDAGMSPGDVRELTGLFETVRYGDAPPTDERERRALAALRRIEATYSGDRDPGDGGTGRDAGDGGTGRHAGDDGSGGAPPDGSTGSGGADR